MINIVFNSKTYKTLLSEAQRLGFCEKDEDGNDFIIENGQIASGGSWFLNIVGEIYQNGEKLDGFWGRLRVNGEVSNLETFSAAIDQYVFLPEKDKWIDLTTGNDAPDFVSGVGVIA